MKRVIQLSKTDLKELNKDHLQYLSEHVIGSGSYGQCYRARYRGIEVIVKKMSHDHTAEGKERAMRKLSARKQRLSSALGDHATTTRCLSHAENLYAWSRNFMV